MEVRVKKSCCEKGEFFLSRSCDLAEFLQIFSEHTQKVYSKYAFTLEYPQIAFYMSNLKGQYLFIEHIAQDGYSVKYIDSEQKLVFTNNIYEMSVVEKTSLFFDGQIEQLLLGMKKGVYKETVADNFNDGNFLYTYKPGHRFIFIYELVVSITVPIILFVFLQDMPLFANLIFSSFYPVAFIMQVIYRINYIKESKRIAIKVSKCNPKIEGVLDGKEFSFLKSEIKELIIYHNSGLKKTGYMIYLFTRIVLIENSILNIPDMVIDSDLIIEKFPGTKITWKSVNFPYMKRKSRISPRAANL